MIKYTTLYFDLDNTLLDFSAAESHAIKKVFYDFGIKNDEETVALYSKINEKYWHLYEKGAMTKSQILVERFRETFDTLKIGGDPVLINEHYFEALSNCAFTVKGARETLKALKEKGYTVYVTTNGISRTQNKRIKLSGLEPFFDKVFVSESVGSQKPMKEYFDYVYSCGTQKDKSKILVIGDSMSSDIKGGINFGVDTCWYDAYGKPRQYETTFTVKTLTELLDIL